jgi:organic radical activating enzyme
MSGCQLAFFIRDGKVASRMEYWAGPLVLEIGPRAFVRIGGCRLDSDGCDDHIAEWFDDGTVELLLRAADETDEP